MAQQAHTFGDRKTGKLRYLLFLPEGYKGKKRRKWPLILFLHGSAERGENPDILRKHGIPKIVEERPDFPFITVSPQCPETSAWGRLIEKLAGLLDHILETTNSDPRRVYLTGISMGGNGAWQFALQYPHRFAAVAPVCGYGLASQGFPERICALKDIPIWIFHGGADRIVPVRESQRLHDALVQCGSNVQLTVYPRCGHDSWTRTYENPELYDWFLSHSLSAES